MINVLSLLCVRPHAVALHSGNIRIGLRCAMLPFNQYIMYICVTIMERIMVKVNWRNYPVDIGMVLF